MKVRESFFGAAGVGILLVMWHLGSLFTRKVPSPIVVLEYLSRNFVYSRTLEAYGLGENGLLDMIWYTTGSVLIAVLIGICLGTIVGLTSARIWFIHKAIEPLVLTGGTIPILVLAPFFLIWFGIHRAAGIALVAAYTAVILVIYAEKAAQNLDPVYELSAETLGASSWAVIRDVYLPGTLPGVMGGVRIALAGAWGLQAIAELMGLPSGIGVAVRLLGTQLDVAGILAAILLLGIVAIVVDGLVAAILRYTFRWRAT